MPPHFRSGKVALQEWLCCQCAEIIIKLAYQYRNSTDELRLILDMTYAFSKGVMMASEDPLSAYHHKRNFARTPEPAGVGKSSHPLPIFVIQKHDASHLHYDFRLEVHGVLISWAIPKGPSPDPHIRRLAVPTEDHPLEYANFEGVIPDGNYGAGVVMVWDIGTYENTSKHEGQLVPVDKALRNGHMTFVLHGKKVQGEFALVRTGYNHGRKSTWLLIKKQDESADAVHDPINEQPNSALTGRSLDEIVRAA